MKNMKPDTENTASFNGIKFRKIRVKSGFKSSYVWRGRKNGFCFELSLTRDHSNSFYALRMHDDSYYALVTNKPKGVRFNSLWNNITFTTLQDAFVWCDAFIRSDAFEGKNFSCLGADA